MSNKGRLVEFPRRDESELGEAWTLTTADVAEHLGYDSVKSVRRIPPEKLRYIYRGRERRYRASDVSAYVEEYLFVEETGGAPPDD